MIHDYHAIKLIQQQHPSENQKRIWNGGYYIPTTWETLIAATWLAVAPAF